VDLRPEADIIQGLRDRLFEAIRLRLKADVPVGVYLSGGLGKLPIVCKSNLLTICKTRQRLRA
jgi:Asparagine synthase